MKARAIFSLIELAVACWLVAGTGMAAQMKDADLADTADAEAMPALAAGEKGALLATYEVHKPDEAILLTVKALTAP